MSKVLAIIIAGFVLALGVPQAHAQG